MLSTNVSATYFVPPRCVAILLFTHLRAQRGGLLSAVLSFCSLAHVQPRRCARSLRFLLSLLLSQSSFRCPQAVKRCSQRGVSTAVRTHGLLSLLPILGRPSSSAHSKRDKGRLIFRKRSITARFHWVPRKYSRVALRLRSPGAAQ